MKKILLFITVVFFGLANAQDVSKECEFNYQAYSKKIIEDQGKNIFKSVIEWDFSKTEKNVDCSIEIVPIRDCANGESALRFKEIILLSSKDRNFKKKGMKEIKNSDYMTKCFKWRVVMVNSKTSCEKVTDWEFVSFLNN